MITVESFNVGSSYFTRLVYEGYRVKVKVTGARRVENPYSRSVKLPSAVTPVL